MKKYRIFYLFLFCLIIIFSIAFNEGKSFALQIQWASTVENTNVGNADQALGKPDNYGATFYDGNDTTIETATYGGFGAGDNIEYNGTTLAVLLGISETLLAQADLISFEGQGVSTLPYEGASQWTFTDGINSATVPGSCPLYGTPVLASGNLSASEYASYFGIWENQRVGWVLIDIDRFFPVDPLSPNFKATLFGTGSARGGIQDHPDPDAIGRIGFGYPSSIPEPSTWLLFFSLIGMVSIKKKFN